MNKEQLLLHCIKGLILFEDRFEVVSSENSEWICERLAWHKILPLAAAVSDPGKPKSPIIQTAFKAVILNNMIREKNYEKQIRNVFQIFKDASIDFMPYKGPFWGRQIYPDYTWRHIGDIDLLLNINDARRASAILQKMGYIPDVVTDSEEKDFALRGALTLFNNPSRSNEVPVQLHWELLPSPRFLKKKFILTRDFLTETSIAAWKGITFSVPRPEVQFLYFILHATCQHQFMRFVHIINMIHFIQKFPRLDWELIYNLAESKQAYTPLYYGFKFINAFFQLPERALTYMERLKPQFKTRFAAATLSPIVTLNATRKHGKIRRKIFRAAMSW